LEEQKLFLPPVNWVPYTTSNTNPTKQTNENFTELTLFITLLSTSMPHTLQISSDTTALQLYKTVCRSLFLSIVELKWKEKDQVIYPGQQTLEDMKVPDQTILTANLNVVCQTLPYHTFSLYNR
jgi:hypothetical protein